MPSNSSKKNTLHGPLKQSKCACCLKKYIYRYIFCDVATDKNRVWHSLQREPVSQLFHKPLLILGWLCMNSSPCEPHSKHSCILNWKLNKSWGVHHQNKTILVSIAQTGDKPALFTARGCLQTASSSWRCRSISSCVPQRSSSYFTVFTVSIFTRYWRHFIFARDLCWANASRTNVSPLSAASELS